MIESKKLLNAIEMKLSRMSSDERTQYLQKLGFEFDEPIDRTQYPISSSTEQFWVFDSEINTSETKTTAGSKIIKQVTVINDKGRIIIKYKTGNAIKDNYCLINEKCGRTQKSKRTQKRLRQNKLADK